MKYGLKISLINQILQLAKNNNKIEDIILYGSRILGNYKTGSDIDLTLKGKNLTLKDIFKFENDLDELYIPYKFDISIFHQINNKNLLDHINKYGVSLLN